MSSDIPENATIGNKYRPAMEITDPKEAKEYLEKLIQHNMRFGHSRSEAEEIEKSNLGYFAGYYSDEVRERVERLFECAHPIFGKISVEGSPTPQQALETGLKRGKKIVLGESLKDV